MSFIKNEPTPLTLLQIKLALMKYFKYDKQTKKVQFYEKTDWLQKKRLQHCLAL